MDDTIPGGHSGQSFSIFHLDVLVDTFVPVVVLVVVVVVVVAVLVMVIAKAAVRVALIIVVVVVVVLLLLLLFLLPLGSRRRLGPPDVDGFESSLKHGLAHLSDRVHAKVVRERTLEPGAWCSCELMYFPTSRHRGGYRRGTGSECASWPRWSGRQTSAAQSGTISIIMVITMSRQVAAPHHTTPNHTTRLRRTVKCGYFRTVRLPAW